jgi:UDP-N-acetylmuramoylalanine--D-glutamate ligase
VPPTLAGRRALVLGLGASGVAAARALLAAGADVLVADRGHPDALERTADDLRAAGADVRLGAGSPSLLDGRDLVVPSPGVPEHALVLSAALRGGVAVWSEPELAWRLNAGRSELLAVTGTNGKTTTTELLAACVGAPAAGNIGTPLVELLAGEPPPRVVVELSSFQLRFAETLRPRVAVLLNLAPDHLDWHSSLNAYAAAKARLWAKQTEGDWTVSNADDPGARSVVAAHPPPAATVTFTLDAPTPGQVGIRDGWVVERLGDDGGARPLVGVTVVAVRALQGMGRHNLANVCAATAAALCAGVDAERLAAPLSAFTPGPHRLELVATFGGVRYVNDSKATNPHAAAAALAAFSGASRSIVWIAGGLNKGLDFAALAGPLRAGVRAAVTIGSSGPALAELTRALGIPTVEAGQLDAAVRSAADVARAGDTVLLAPACASMDQFRDYAQRGEVFREAVQALRRGADPRGEVADAS